MKVLIVEDKIAGNRKQMESSNVYWGIGPVEKLAHGLKTALDQTARPDVKTTASLAAVLPVVKETICGLR